MVGKSTALLQPFAPFDLEKRSFSAVKLAIRADDSSLLLHCFGPPHVFVTDLLRSYDAVMKVDGNADKQETGRWVNNRAENSHQPFRRRERAMIRFRRMRTLQKFVAVHASIHNHFNQDRSLSQRDHFKANRTTALAVWRGLCAS